MTNATKYELEGLKYIIRTIRNKYDQLMRIMRTMKCKGNINTINSWKS